MPGFDGSPARIACWARPDPCFHSILSGSVKATAAGLRSAAIALVEIVADAATPRNNGVNGCIQSSAGSAATQPDHTRRRPDLAAAVDHLAISALLSSREMRWLSHSR